MSDPEKTPSLDRQLDALRFVQPSAVLRQRTLTAAREALANDRGAAPSWSLEALLLGLILIFGLALGHPEPWSSTPTTAGPASADVVGLVAEAEVPAAVRHVPATRPLHASSVDSPHLTSSEVSL